MQYKYRVWVYEKNKFCRQARIESDINLDGIIRNGLTIRDDMKEHNHETHIEHVSKEYGWNPDLEELYNILVCKNIKDEREYYFMYINESFCKIGDKIEIKDMYKVKL